MKKVMFENSVSVKELVSFYNLNESVFCGNGVYGVKMGCRGEVEFVEKVSDNRFLVVREVEDILNEFKCEDEFVVSDFVDWNGLGMMYVEMWGEEDCMEYYYVEGGG